jgi:hypothetical protein
MPWRAKLGRLRRSLGPGQRQRKQFGHGSLVPWQLMKFRQPMLPPAAAVFRP